MNLVRASVKASFVNTWGVSLVFTEPRFFWWYSAATTRASCPLITNPFSSHCLTQSSGWRLSKCRQRIVVAVFVPYGLTTYSESCSCRYLSVWIRKSHRNIRKYTYLQNLQNCWLLTTTKNDQTSSAVDFFGTPSRRWLVFAVSESEPEELRSAAAGSLGNITGPGGTTDIIGGLNSWDMTPGPVAVMKGFSSSTIAGCEITWDGWRECGCCTSVWTK